MKEIELKHVSVAVSFVLERAFNLEKLTQIKNLATRKAQSLYISRLYRAMAHYYKDFPNIRKWASAHSLAVSQCQNFMEFYSTKDKKTFRVKRRNGCKDHYCPNCQKAYSYKQSIRLMPILDWLLSQKTRSGKGYKYSLLFITPTFPNVKPTIKDVSDSQKQYKRWVRNFIYELRGFGKDRKGRRYKGQALGALVKFEQTINHHSFMINLHSHILMIVHNSYFHSRYFINNKEWDNLWQNACGHKYDIKVEACYYKGKNGKRHLHNRKTLKRAVSEIVKYETKSQDFVSINKKFCPKQNRIAKQTLKCFAALVWGLKGNRRYQPYGLFGKLIHQYNIGFHKFDKFIKRDKNVYYYDTKTKYNYAKKYYEAKYLHDFTNLQIVKEYFTRGIHLAGLNHLKNYARQHGFTLKEWFNIYQHYVHCASVARLQNNLKKSEKVEDKFNNRYDTLVNKYEKYYGPISKNISVIELEKDVDGINQNPF